MEAWRQRHGACSFDYKSHNIFFGDGGLFWIETKKLRVPRSTGFRDKPNGSIEMVFSKKKSKTIDDHYAGLWFTELDETIDYLQSMKKMLNKIGIATAQTIRPEFLKEIEHSQAYDQISRLIFERKSITFNELKRKLRRIKPRLLKRIIGDLKKHKRIAVKKDAIIWIFKPSPRIRKW